MWKVGTVIGYTNCLCDLLEICIVVVPVGDENNWDVRDIEKITCIYVSVCGIQ